MSGCQSCNSCNYGNTCSNCNSCESCNTNCNASSGCNTIQSFCSSNQSAGGFSFNQTLNKDDLFLTKTNWNGLLEYINDAYSRGSNSLKNNAQSGSGVSGSGKGGSSGLPDEDSNVFMTASMFNDVAEALGGLGSTSSITFYNPLTKQNQTSMEGGPNGDIIFGSYFKELESYASGLKYKTTQCDNCNAGCNVKCNTCLKCNNNDNCGSCDKKCESHSSNTCCSTTCQHSCQSCNVCQNQTEDKTKK